MVAILLKIFWSDHKWSDSSENPIENYLQQY